MTLADLHQASTLVTSIRSNARLIEAFVSDRKSLQTQLVTFDEEGREEAARVLVAQQRRFIIRLNAMGVDCTLEDFDAPES